jgi:hypothetical protein
LAHVGFLVLVAFSFVNFGGIKVWPGLSIQTFESTSCWRIFNPGQTLTPPRLIIEKQPTREIQHWPNSAVSCINSTNDESMILFEKGDANANDEGAEGNRALARKHVQRLEESRSLIDFNGILCRATIRAHSLLDLQRVNGWVGWLRNGKVMPPIISQ